MKSHLKLLAVAHAWIISSGAAAALLALVFGELRLFTFALPAVAIVAAVVGLPLYYAARRAGMDKPIVAAAAGFLVASAVPVLLAVTAARPDAASSNGEATVTNGAYTLAGWLQAVGLVATIGVMGLVGGLIFLSIVNRLGQSKTDDNGARDSRLAMTLAMLLSALVVGAAFAIPYITTDSSCHNMFRSGRSNTYSPEASFEIRDGADSWAQLAGEVARFAEAHGWSLRHSQSVVPEISLCKESGTNIRVSPHPLSSDVLFVAFQPQGGDSWKLEFRAFHDDIKSRWHPRIQWRDGEGNIVAAPDWTSAP